MQIKCFVCVCVPVFVLRSFGTMTSTDSDHIAMFVCRCCPHSFEREIKKKRRKRRTKKKTLMNVSAYMSARRQCVVFAVRSLE